jgi:hypothetical protein
VRLGDHLVTSEFKEYRPLPRQSTSGKVEQDACYPQDICYQKEQRESKTKCDKFANRISHSNSPEAVRERSKLIAVNFPPLGRHINIGGRGVLHLYSPSFVF